MKSFHALLCWLLVASHCLAGITYTGAPSQTTYYVRIATSASASVAVALSEGSGGAVGFYTVSDAALVTAGLSSAGTYSFKVFSGSTPSTTANDTLLATGVLPWSGSVEIGAPANVTQVSGDATAADNAEFYFDGTGYGVHVLGTEMTNVQSATVFDLSAGSSTNDFYKGCTITTGGGSNRAIGYVASYVGATKTVTVDWAGATGFTADTGAVQISLPGYATDDRAAASTAQTKIGFLPSATAGAAGGVAIVGSNMGSVTGISGVTFPANFNTLTIANNAVAANVTRWLDTAVTVNISGVPKVDITHVQGEEASAVSGAIDVNVVKLIGNTIELSPP